MPRRQPLNEDTVSVKSGRAIPSPGGPGMTLVISLYVPEGIVMAADSRLTLNVTQNQGEKQIIQLAAAESDSTTKLFVTPERIGISTCGAAEVNGSQIAGLIERFIREVLPKGATTAPEIPKRLLAHFRSMSPVPAVFFHVAGYALEGTRFVQHVWVVDVANNTVTRVNGDGVFGAHWGGESDVLVRLLQQVSQVDAEGKVTTRLPYYQIPWQFFSLQDAIDFSIYAIQATIDSLRFQPRAKTVGGPVDVLVIRPEEAIWVKRKQLRA
jgi:hypothetical protein